MGSEDFAFMLQCVPGVTSSWATATRRPLHHPAYDFDDNAIPYGVAYWSELARRVLPMG